MKLLTIKRFNDGQFRVTDHQNNRLPKVNWYDDYTIATGLCRLRLEKTLEDYNLYILHIPFINLWLVW